MIRVFFDPQPRMPRPITLHIEGFDPQETVFPHGIH
jgi:hypothetical protein